MIKKNKTSAGENIKVLNSSWTFGGNVANKFNAHVERSIPFYNEGHALICRISDFFLKNKSTCFELGSSTGTLLKKLAVRHKNKNINFIGVDSEINMVKKSKKELKKFKNIFIKKGDITKYKLKESNLIISYYCIQFVPINKRQKLISDIYKSLNKGGCFLFFEKIRMKNSKLQDISSTIYTDFKLEHGYTPAEIIAKLRSLKGVLEPNLTNENINLLKKAGFKEIETIFNYIPFEGIMAIK